MPNVPDYLKYRDDLETIAPDEPETHRKIIEVMTHGMNLGREKYGRTVRISHAKAHGLMDATLTVYDNLPPELAQGLFAQAKTFKALVRMAQAPGELLDDSKVQTDRGLSVKVLDVPGPTLDPSAGPVQDWVFDVGKQFLASDAKTFLQAFKPNAELAPKLSDSVKGAVSTAARATNSLLNAFGVNSEKLAFYGHPPRHPIAEFYFSQVPYRYGNYVAKLGFFPIDPRQEALKDEDVQPETPDGLRDEMNNFLAQQPAAFELRVQLNTDPDKMSIEDGMSEWSEGESSYRAVARLDIPVQPAWRPDRDSSFENLVFSPGHALVAHRPLGSINRARLTVYSVLSARRLAENGQAERKSEALA